MTQKIDSLRAMHSIIKQGARLALALGTAFAAARADATCTVVFSVANVQMGNTTVSLLRASGVPGYRLMGARNQIVNVNCNVPQATLRLELGGLTPIIGKPLVNWGSVGAIQMRAMNATVAETPVNIKFESSPSSAYAQALDITKNDIISFDLSGVPVNNRKSFSLQLQLTGLLPENLPLRSKEILDSSISVQLLGAQ